MPEQHLLAADLPGLAGCDPSKLELNLNDCYRLGESQKVGDVYDTPATLVNILVRNAFVISGILIFILIFYAGWLFITNESKGKEEAKGVMEAAVVGFIMMFAAYWIVQIIKVVTGADILL